MACRRVTDSKVANIFEDRLADVWICQMEKYRDYDKFVNAANVNLKHGAGDVRQLPMEQAVTFMELIRSAGRLEMRLPGRYWRSDSVKESRGQP